MPNLFCRNPFEKVEVSLDGRCYLCCPAWLPTSIGSLKESSLDEVWNSPVAQEIRASILDGTFKYCRREKCASLQREESPVYRRDEITRLHFLEIINEKIKIIEDGPSNIVLSYDRACNLSCPTCRTGIAVLTAEDRRDAVLFMDKTAPFFRFADRLKLLGNGDPFASPHTFRFLENLNSDEYPNLKVALHTNGLLFTPSRWERLKKIRRSIYQVEVSIDAATSETYRKNRRGGEFSRLLENLGFIGELRRSGELMELIFSFVVQQNNWREMEKFVELGRFYSADKVSFFKLVDWGTFSADEFKARSIHEPGHPEHELFLAELRKDIFEDPIVSLSNLEFLKRGACGHPAD